jgi:hypothetical protein
MATEFTRINDPVGFGVSSSKTAKPIRNDLGDVSVIQDFFNQIPASEGGSKESPLTVNGKITGPNDPTVQVIRRFQQTQFGFQDGVVDPRQKTENRMHEILQRLLGGDDPPAPATKTLDILIRIMGQDPAAAAAGTPTGDGQSAIGVPAAEALRPLIETAEYLETHAPVLLINFNGGGGLRNPASDPTDKIVAIVKNVRSTAVSSPGKVVIYGWSSGGRNAATLTRALVNKEKIAVAYLGIADGAFDNAKDTERTAGVTVGTGQNFFEAVSNDLDKDFPGEFEFHGDVTGCVNQSFDTQPFYQDAKAKYDKDKAGRFVVTDRQKRKLAINFFDDVHKKAVQDGHVTIQASAIATLKAKS